MSKKHPASLLFAGMILAGSMLIGCSNRGTTDIVPLEPPPKAGPQTPTLPPTPTHFQTGKLWISPALPPGLLAFWDEALLEDQGIQIVDDPELADLRVAPGGEEHISTWVYVLVAPFPTINDSLSWEALVDIWTGDGVSIPLLIGQSELAPLEARLGPPGDAVQMVPDGQLIDRAWQLGLAYALVPFEALEPRWKVIELDGQAPIRKNFNLEAYPLKLEIAVLGPTGARERLSGVLEIPASNYDPEQMTVLVMTGVTALTRATAWQMDRQGVGFPAEKIGDWLADADLTHISNEVAFTSECPLPDPSQPGLRFCSHPAHMELLELIGVDVIELTGNHVLDYGTEALADTLAEYAQRGWGVFGGGPTLEESFQPYLVEHHGNKFAFLGCNQAGPKFAWAVEGKPGSTPCSEERLFSEVRALVEQDYHVVFTYQWGEGSVVTENQRETFRSTVDAGAVIVNGSQAHQPFGMEFYQGGFIHYGLGNLFFDQMQSLDLRSELIDRHVFYAGRYISTELLSALLESYAQPRPMTVEERSALLEKIFSMSGW